MRMRRNAESDRRSVCFSTGQSATCKGGVVPCVCVCFCVPLSLHFPPLNELRFPVIKSLVFSPLLSCLSLLSLSFSIALGNSFIRVIGLNVPWSFTLIQREFSIYLVKWDNDETRIIGGSRFLLFHLERNCVARKQYNSHHWQITNEFMESFCFLFALITNFCTRERYRDTQTRAGYRALCLWMERPIFLCKKLLLLLVWLSCVAVLVFVSHPPHQCINTHSFQNTNHSYRQK